MSEAANTGVLRKLIPNHPVWIVIGIVVVATALGGWLAYHLVQDANGAEACPKQPVEASVQKASSSALTLSGLPATIPFAFGYGRGAETFETTFTVSSTDATLPQTIESVQLPLTTSSGRTISAVTATATQIEQTHTYLLRVCVNASGNGGADPGSYTSSLVFPNASVPQGTNPIVTATLQSQFVPYVLWVFGPPALLLSLLYATMILVRRGDPDIDSSMGKLWRTVLHDLWSANGVVAVVVGIGAGFGVWKAQLFLNPTWGASWPDIPTGIVSMAAVIVTATSIPMAFASQKVAPKAQPASSPAPAPAPAHPGPAPAPAPPTP